MYVELYLRLMDKINEMNKNEKNIKRIKMGPCPPKSSPGPAPEPNNACVFKFRVICLKNAMHLTLAVLQQLSLVSIST